MGVGVSRPVFVRVGVCGGWECVCMCVGLHAWCIVCVCEGFGGCVVYVWVWTEVSVSVGVSCGGVGLRVCTRVRVKGVCAYVCTCVVCM